MSENDQELSLLLEKDHRHGLEHFPEIFVTCRQCDGEGKLDDGRGQDGETVWVDCPSCYGTGKQGPVPREPDTGVIKDGFRPRKKRPAGWLKAAIKDGSVRDPNAPDPDTGKDYSGAEVVRAPVATIDGEGTG